MPNFDGLHGEDTENPHLNKQIIEVTALMRMSDDKAGFERFSDKTFPRGKDKTLELPEGA